jgi:hypothetical protein
VSDESTPLDSALDLFVYVPVGLAVTMAEELPKLAAKGRAQLGGRIAVARMIGQFAVMQGRKEVDRRLGSSSNGGGAPRPASPPASTGAGATGSSPGAVSAATSSSGPTVAGRAAAPSAASPSASTSSASTASASTASASTPGASTSTAISPASAGTSASGSTAMTPAAGTASAGSAPSGRAATTKRTTRPGASDASAAGSSAPPPDVASLAIPGYDSLSASQVVQRLAGLSQSELGAVGRYEAASRGRRTILARVAQLQTR